MTSCVCCSVRMSLCQPQPCTQNSCAALANAAGFAAVRVEKRRRVAEIAARDLTGEIGLEEVGRALSDLATACIDAALASLEGEDELAVVGMGKLGGRELNY